MLKACRNEKNATSGSIEDLLLRVLFRYLVKKSGNDKEIDLEIQKGLVVRVLPSIYSKLEEIQGKYSGVHRGFFVGIPSYISIGSLRD